MVLLYKLQTLSSSVIQRKNMNKNVRWNVIFLWQLLQDNHDLVLANSAQATRRETPAVPMNTAFHCTTSTQHDISYRLNGQSVQIIDTALGFGPKIFPNVTF